MEAIVMITRACLTLLLFAACTACLVMVSTHGPAVAAKPNPQPNVLAAITPAR
jgi:hypothetical protein